MLKLTQGRDQSTRASGLQTVGKLAFTMLTKLALLCLPLASAWLVAPACRPPRSLRAAEGDDLLGDALVDLLGAPEEPAPAPAPAPAAPEPSQEPARETKAAAAKPPVEEPAPPEASQVDVEALVNKLSIAKIKEFITSEGGSLPKGRPKKKEYVTRALDIVAKDSASDTKAKLEKMLST